MSNISTTRRVDIDGLVSVDNGRIIISVADKGEFDLAKIMKDFDGFECKISITYSGEYSFDA